MGYRCKKCVEEVESTYGDDISYETLGIGLNPMLHTHAKNPNQWMFRLATNHEVVSLIDFPRIFNSWLQFLSDYGT